MCIRDRGTGSRPGRQQERGAGVGESVGRQSARERRRVGDPQLGGDGGRLTAGDQDGAVPPGRDEGLRDLQGVEHAVAGVLHVEDRAGQAELGGHDVGRRRFDHVLAGRREDHQVDVGGPDPLVGQEFAGGARRQIGRLLVVVDQVYARHAGQLGDQPGRRGEAAAGGGDLGLPFAHAGPAFGQVRGGPRQAGPKVAHGLTLGRRVQAPRRPTPLMCLSARVWRCRAFV